MSQCRDMTQSFSPLSRMNECRENSKCTGPLLLECRTIWCYFLVVDDCVEQMGDLVHKRVLPANNVTLRPPVRPERMIGFGHEHIGEPPRFPGRGVFPVDL